MTMEMKDHLEQGLAAAIVYAAGALFASPFLVLLTGFIAY